MKKLIIVLALLLISSPAWAVAQLKHTVCPSGCDYTSLNAAFTHLEATHTNLVTADVYADIEISGDWTAAADTTAAGIGGITTDSTHYINVYTTVEARHPGHWDATKYRIIISGENYGP